MLGNSNSLISGNYLECRACPTNFPYVSSKHSLKISAKNDSFYHKQFMQKLVTIRQIHQYFAIKSNNATQF